MVNTHLSSAWEHPDIQIMQMKFLLLKLEGYSVSKACGELKWPIIFGGDLNAKPNSDLYHFIANRKLPKGSKVSKKDALSLSFY